MGFKKTFSPILFFTKVSRREQEYVNKKDQSSTSVADPYILYSGRIQYFDNLRIRIQESQ